MAFSDHLTRQEKLIKALIESVIKHLSMEMKHLIRYHHNWMNSTKLIKCSPDPTNPLFKEFPESVLW